MLRKTCLLLTLLCFGLVLKAQNENDLGSFPEVTTFSVNDFKASAQIWHGVQGEDGLLYFANNKGVILFDGSRWGRIATHQEGKITRLLKASNDSIYVSGDNEIGVISHDSVGKAFIKPLLTDKMIPYGLGLIWNIQERKDKSILFIGSNGVISYKSGVSKQLLKLTQGKITTSLRFGQGFLILEKLDHQEQNSDIQLLYLADGTDNFTTVPSPTYGALKNIRGVLDYKNQLILFDEKGGTYTCEEKSTGKFEWKENTIHFEGLTNYVVNCVRVHKNYVYVGTDANGLIVYDKQGHFIRSIAEAEGLSNLSVFELFFDKNSNLWLLLDNGIGLVELSSPVTSFTSKQGVLASTEAMAQFNSKYILSTRSDLFINKKVDGTTVFENSGITHEPTFGIKIFETSQGTKCLVIGYNGIYEITPQWKKLIAKYDVYGWSLLQSTTNKDIIYCGLDLPGGIGKLELTKNGWEYEVLIDDAGGLTRSLAQVGNKLYFAVKDKGIGVYDLSTKSVKYIAETPKLSNNLVYYISKFQNELFVGTNNGLYTLDPKTEILTPVKNVKNGVLFEPKLYIHRIHNENDNRLWMVLFRNEELQTESREIGFLQKVDGQWVWETAPLSIVEEDVIHDIMHDDKGLLWFGGEKGVYVYNVKAKDELNVPFSVAISKISTLNDTVYSIAKSLVTNFSMAYSNNFIKFEFSSPVYYGYGKMKYRTKLEGFDSEWSDWTTMNSTNYTKLPEGNYTFLVQSIDIYGNVSSTTSFPFTILPPWYRTWWAYVLYVVFGLLFIIGIIRVSIHRIKQQNQKLENTVKIRTQEIADQNHLLEHQKNEIETKNNDILDSIKYAKRIQNTILPDTDKLNSLFNQHFVFYQPKDIVSGDFYWADSVNGNVLFSAIDCTGHGVPGAFVSIVAHNGLRRSTNEFKLHHPNEVLDKLQEVVVESFKSQNQSEVKDGMDLALCCINKEGTKLEYAGANNPCVIIRNGEIIELKADKQPIGQFSDSKPFTLQTFDLKKDDCIYLYSDGYVDQFGGEKGKKFKSKAFKDLLVTIYHLPMNEQFAIIQNTFEDWRKGFEQIDDVCVFAVKI